MSRVYFIHDERGESQIPEADLPLCIGGQQHGDVVLPDVPDDAVLAHIALSEGHAFIQPSGGTQPLFHNHEYLTASKWLKSGDLVQAGEAVLQWTVKGDQVFIAIRRHAPETALVPPTAPLPAESPQGRAMPVVAQEGVARHGHQRIRRLLVGLFVILVVAAAFVLIATPVAVQISPQPEEQSLGGFPPAVPVGRRLLVLPGDYTVRARREGYYPLEESVTISGGGFQELPFELKELPGRIRISLSPEVPFRLFVGDTQVTMGSVGIAELDRGLQQLRLTTERYLPEERELDVAGYGQLQEVTFTLRPAWAAVRITSQPPGAEVRVDDEVLGVTPLEAELLQGERRIELSLAGHKPVALQQAVQAGQALELETLVLPPADGRLSLDSQPGGATVSVDGEFRGATPLSVALSSVVEHRIRLSKPGYQLSEKTVTLAPEEAQELAVDLVPQYGVVFVTARPADTKLSVDGKPAGRATQRLRLTTRPHTLEFRKAGYTTQQVSVTPRAGVSQNVDVIMETPTSARASATPSSLTTGAGQRIQLVRPGEAFRMGASRREAGRRANESPRLVQLTRAFYLGLNEVTNGEFRRFRASHNSGTAEGVSLNDEGLPVVNVSWDDAARYCNWLSSRDGLPLAYREEGGRMLVVKPMTTGYRLPTEAEWAYVARVHGRGTPARYPWSGNYPPVSMAGNFADARIADTLADTVPGYDDGYRGAAPVASFAAHPKGFHDLGGNVAEWTNDFYSVYPGQAERLVKDPVGPLTGDHHVVRDASWRKGSIAELRYSYRDYSRTARDDLGFRLARYAN